jgi:hypothetical protein
MPLPKDRFSAHLRILHGVRGKAKEILVLDGIRISGRRPVQVGIRRFLAVDGSASGPASGMSGWIEPSSTVRLVPDPSPEQTRLFPSGENVTDCGWLRVTAANATGGRTVHGYAPDRKVGGKAGVFLQGAGHHKRARILSPGPTGNRGPGKPHFCVRENIPPPVAAVCIDKTQAAG